MKFSAFRSDVIVTILWDSLYQIVGQLSGITVGSK